MNEIARNIAVVKSNLPPHTRLVAVSKFHPVEAIREAYDAGQRIFGESRVQELVAKQAVLPDDIEWHFIGHLQTNKVKQLVPFISLIHSIDSPHLLQEVEKEAARCNRTVDCLLQIHIAAEETKYGFTFDECREYLASGAWRTLSHIRLRGVMGMATLTDDTAAVQREFAALQKFYTEIKRDFFAGDDRFCEISSGMSHDYKLAVGCGSTLVRIGSFIFGERIINP